jgi:ribosomal protein S27E
MEMAGNELKLDGNAVAGILQEIFVHEMTMARTTCASCGAMGPLGGLAVFVHAPGTVIRCPVCDNVLMSIVHGGGRYWIELQGIRSLQFSETPAGS